MPKIRNNRNICLYCFGDLDERRICKACKKKADDEPNLPHQLGKRSMLEKRYLIDKAIGEGGFGITYAAWDVVRGIKVAIKEYYPSRLQPRIKAFHRRSQKPLLHQQSGGTSKRLRLFFGQQYRLYRHGVS